MREHDHIVEPLFGALGDGEPREQQVSEAPRGPSRRRLAVLFGGGLLAIGAALYAGWVGLS